MMRRAFLLCALLAMTASAAATAAGVSTAPSRTSKPSSQALQPLLAPVALKTSTTTVLSSQLAAPTKTSKSATVPRSAVSKVGSSIVCTVATYSDAQCSNGIATQTGVAVGSCFGVTGTYDVETIAMPRRALTRSHLCRVFAMIG